MLRGIEREEGDGLEIYSDHHQRTCAVTEDKEEHGSCVFKLYCSLPLRIRHARLPRVEGSSRPLHRNRGQTENQKLQIEDDLALLTSQHQQRRRSTSSFSHLLYYTMSCTTIKFYTAATSYRRSHACAYSFVINSLTSGFTSRISQL